ncbi:MAG: hypothetical protein KBS43_03095 [Oscillospiraceae bacterium]|nr:hypothetical protein [Candidatus Limimonas coprohippi]
MFEIIKKIVKIVLKVVGLAFAGLFAYIVWAINPWNMPAIFKRNYPEAFEKMPLSLISPFIKIY